MAAGRRQGTRLPSTRWLVAGAVGVACAIAAVLIALSAFGSSDEEKALPTSFATDRLAIFDGVAQSGEILGQAGAPVTMIEYADLQCPFCAQYSLETLPALIREYVKTGKVRMLLRPIAFLGPDSPNGVKAVVAAALQDHGWEMAELLFQNQGPENGGWLSEEFVMDAAAAVPGLDTEKFESDYDSDTVRDIASATGAAANAAGVDHTPFFLLGKSGKPGDPLEVTSLEPPPFRAAFDKLLG